MIRPTFYISPGLARELPEPMWPLWPAVGPNFSHETGLVSFLAKDPNAQHNSLRCARSLGANSLAQIAASRQEGVLEAWKIDLVEASARLKLGEVDAALALLNSVAGEPGFISSLGAPPSRCRYPLLSQHPLWLLAHVAVEMGCMRKVFPQLLSMGLSARASLEPDLASGVLRNSLASGSWDAFDVILKQGWSLAPADLKDLQKYLPELAMRLDNAPPGVFAYDSELIPGLSPLCRACERLGLSTEAFKPFEKKLEVYSKNPWRATLASLVPSRKKYVANAHLMAPRRTTGIQLRQPSEK